MPTTKRKRDREDGDDSDKNPDYSLSQDPQPEEDDEDILLEVLYPSAPCETKESIASGNAAGDASKPKKKRIRNRSKPKAAATSDEAPSETPKRARKRKPSNSGSGVSKRSRRSLANTCATTDENLYQGGEQTPGDARCTNPTLLRHYTSATSPIPRPYTQSRVPNRKRSERPPVQIISDERDRLRYYLSPKRETILRLLREFSVRMGMHFMLFMMPHGAPATLFHNGDVQEMTSCALESYQSMLQVATGSSDPQDVGVCRYYNIHTYDATPRMSTLGTNTAHQRQWPEMRFKGREGEGIVSVNYQHMRPYATMAQSPLYDEDPQRRAQFVKYCIDSGYNSNIVLATNDDHVEFDHTTEELCDMMLEEYLDAQAEQLCSSDDGIPAHGE